MYSLLKRRTILYIEEDKQILDDISSQLAPYFSHFYAASDIKTGRDIVQATTIDILLIDINLPKEKSITFIKSIRKKDPCMPIVVLSECTRANYLLSLIELKLETCILKPWTKQKQYTLLQKLQEHYAADHIKELQEGVYVDSIAATVRFEDIVHPLTPKELQFLEVILSKKFITYDEISQLWEEQIPSDDAIRSFVKTLRKKLPEEILKNRQNLGYFVQERRSTVNA